MKPTFSRSSTISLGGNSGNSSDERLHTVHDVNVAHVGSVIVLQDKPIKEGHLGSGLEDTVEFLEERPHDLWHR